MSSLNIYTTEVGTNQVNLRFGKSTYFRINIFRVAVKSFAVSV